MMCPEAFGFAFSFNCLQHQNDAGVVCRGECISGLPQGQSWSFNHTVTPLNVDSVHPWKIQALLVRMGR